MHKTPLYVAAFFTAVYVFGIICGAFTTKEMAWLINPAITPYTIGCDLSQPPPPFDKGETDPYIIKIVDRAEMKRLIEDPLFAITKQRIKFCGYTDVHVTPNVIYLWDKAVSKELITHEIGHIRGWRHPSLLQRPASSK